MEMSVTNSKLRSSRKPIFQKKEKENVAQESVFNRTSSFQPVMANKDHPPITRIITQPRVNNFIKSETTQSPFNFPQRIHYSQPNFGVIHPPQPQPMLLQTQPKPFYQPSTIRIQQNRPATTLIHTQPLPTLSTAYIQEHPQEKQYPSLIGVERVVRPLTEDSRLQSNQQTHLLSPTSIKQPSQIRVFQPINRKQPISDAVSKLTEMNNMLSENYEILYNEFQTLKSNIENNLHEEQVVNESTFLRRSINQIENIFHCQTNCTLAQMDEIYRRARDRPSHLHKSHMKVKYAFS